MTIVSKHPTHGEFILHIAGTDSSVLGLFTHLQNLLWSLLHLLTWKPATK
jgi:hypothetical protein